MWYFPQQSFPIAHSLHINSDQFLINFYIPCQTQYFVHIINPFLVSSKLFQYPQMLSLSSKCKRLFNPELMDVNMTNYATMTRLFSLSTNFYHPQNPRNSFNGQKHPSMPSEIHQYVKKEYANKSLLNELSTLQNQIDSKHLSQSEKLQNKYNRCWKK